MEKPYKFKGEDVSTSSGDEVSDTLKIWEAPALLEAKKHQSALIVSSFLKSKGIPKEMADNKAEELVTRARIEQAKEKIPRMIIGWIFILVGAAGIVGSFFYNAGSWYFLGSPILIGLWILHGMKQGQKYT